MEQINKRVDHKDITIGTRKFRLSKLDALTGSYMLFKLVGMLAPIFKDIDLKETKKNLKSSIKNNNLKNNNANNSEDTEISGSDIAQILTEITKLPKEDFDYIQRECLKVVEELYPNNPGHTSKVLNELGNFEICDPNTPLILNLTVQSLIFNASGFFGEGLSALNLEGLTTSLQNSLT